MDTPIEISSESSSDDEHGFSDSGSDSFDSDFDPETLKSHTKINTPRPSLTELQGILENIGNLDEEFMLDIDDMKTEMEMQKNNKTRDSFSYDSDNNDEHKIKSKSSSPIPPNTTDTKEQPNNSIEKPFKRTETVSQTKINSHWYINQYLCYKYLGKGSFGKVCLAKDIKSNKKVAIKVLNKSLLKRKRILRKNKPPTNMLENIFREIAIMKKLNHPNLIKILEVIDDPNNDKLYMILDYMDNGSVLGEQGAEAKCDPMTDHEMIRKYMRDMMLGLDYLHTNDIIHGDIKPENLLLSQSNKLKICDFGVSFILDDEICPNKDGIISRSQGTPAFTAPETGSKSFNAYPIDIWAMGVTLYMMITGICPFAGNGIYDTYEKIQSYNPPIENLNIGTNIKDFLIKILQKDPKERITLKECMIHPWITNNGTDPLMHPQMYKDEKFEKRVSVTKQDIEYAVNLPENTIKHLRKASDTIDNLKKQMELDVINKENKEEESDTQPPQISSKKKPSKPSKPIKKLPNKTAPSQSDKSELKKKPSIKNKKKNKKEYNPLTDSNSANSIIVNMNQVETTTYTNKSIKITLKNSFSNPNNNTKKKNKKINKKKALTPNPKIKSKKTPKKPTKNAPVNPKKKIIKNKNKTPKKPNKQPPNLKNKGTNTRKSTPNIGKKKDTVKKKRTKKGPLSPKNKALPPSIKKRKKKDGKNVVIDRPSNISPSFVKKRTASEIKRNKTKSIKNGKLDKKNKNKNNKSPKNSKSPPNKPLPNSKKKGKQIKNTKS